MGIGGEPDARAYGFQGGGALQDGDRPAAAVQCQRGGESADSAADALLEAAVRRLAEREAAVLTARERPAAARAGAGAGAEDAGATVAEALSLALHRYLSLHRELLLARYGLALEATRRPELRAVYDRAGRAFREPMAAMLAAAGSADPERHAMSMVAWCDGILFSCIAGQFHAVAPTRAALRTSCAELLDGMLRG
ncbi:TetR/AcrR family transcriptional regulator [Streptomyces platensis]|uniref:TetR/AcrR family transcriptional regulator n=1 Tax=Streptomyces platensis TaxID=58346 RepID=UPI002E8210E3|nr:TetR/AcrR family transcriptional regulator [Streptomyces platensis]WUB85030.1 TetR/AcrR family transcriptional regulator [Streptomyces platensis]